MAKATHKLIFIYPYPDSPIMYEPKPACDTEGHIHADVRWTRVTCKRCLKLKGKSRVKKQR